MQSDEMRSSFDSGSGPVFKRVIPPHDPHNPNERLVLERFSLHPENGRATTWEVRMFDPAGPFHVYFFHRALVQLQLWNAYHRVSILTPSRLTRDYFEAFPVNSRTFSSTQYCVVANELRVTCGVALPNKQQVASLCSRYVSYTGKGD